jgi:hypothetical protein
MLHNAINAIRDNISALGYIEKCAGLVQKVIQYDESEQAQALGLKVVRSSYPVSSQINALECWQNGRYTDLVPSSEKMSLAYCEATSDIMESFVRNMDYAKEYSQSFKYVFWLNLPKMGISTEYVKENIIIEALRVINETMGFQFGGVQMGMIASTNLISHHEPSIFSEYTYDNNVIQNMMYPYDYFAINFKVTALISDNCLPPFVLSSPIQCVIL